MANRIDATLGGVDTVNAVKDAWVANTSGNADARTWIVNAGTTLGLLLANDATRRAALAIACATLNQSFSKTGNLYRVNNECQIAHEYISTSGVRDMIAALMAD